MIVYLSDPVRAKIVDRRHADQMPQGAVVMETLRAQQSWLLATFGADGPDTPAPADDLPADGFLPGPRVHRRGTTLPTRPFSLQLSAAEAAGVGKLADACQMSRSEMVETAARHHFQLDD